MNWRSVEDVKKHFEEVGEGKELSTETVAPPRERTVPIHGSSLTPAFFGFKKNGNAYHGIIHLSWCCFPDYRPDGKPSTITVVSSQMPAVGSVASDEAFLIRWIAAAVISRWTLAPVFAVRTAASAVRLMTQALQTRQSIAAVANAGECDG